MLLILRIGKISQDKEVFDLLTLMTELTVDEQAELFIESDISFITTNDLCERMDIESTINMKKEWWKKRSKKLFN